MKLVIISGRSGSGKSTALNVLEDAGFYSIDNLPASLLTALVAEIRSSPSPEHENLALCIDARNISRQLQELPTLLSQLPDDVETSVIYLDADGGTIGYEDVFTKLEMCRRHYAAVGLGADYVDAFVR